MKKILLIVGLAFGCSAVYAQGVQTGDNNRAEVNSNAADNANSTVTVTQLEGNQTALITQGPDNPGTMGGELTIVTRQRNIGAVNRSVGNFIEIMQAGTGNIIRADQLGRRNVAMLTQTLDAADSRIITDQSGERNLITVEQRNGQGYRATITQGAPIGNAQFNNPPTLFPSLPSTIRNTARVVQGGDFLSGSGRLVIDQLGSAGFASVVQLGGASAFNELNIIQTNNGGAEVQQDGNNNRIDIDQNGFQAAIVEQGNLTVTNTATIFQGGAIGPNDDTRNSAIVRQLKGDGNEATIFQNFQNSEKNLATVVQSGTRLGAADVSTVTIEQRGKSGTVDVNQTLGGSGNEVTIDQRNSQLRFGSVATLDQNGDNNAIDILQNGNWNSIGSATSGGTFATGRAKQEGQDNTTDINQIGSRNQIALSQDGSDNTIDINQENEEFNVLGNKATAIQAEGVTDSDITINQNVNDGDDNEATVRQTRGDRNSATITQFEGNTATVTQSGGKEVPTATPSTVNIDQSLSTNGTATAVQTASTLGGTINITQEEDDNVASVMQTDGRLNTATVNQTDDGNNATVTQSGTVDNFIASDVTINQEGKMSMATVNQASNGSTVEVDQDNSDEATVTQVAGGANNIVDINQEGTLAGGGHSATVTQGGDDNTFNVDQSSPTGLDGNMVMGEQMGAGNLADVDQEGPGNQATVDQDGEQNNIEIDQNSEAASGTPNVANATQSANTSDGFITIDQSLGLTGQEGGNTATVNQTRGDENAATILQLKNNTATITQSGDKDGITGLTSVVTIDQSLSTNGEATVTQADGTFGALVEITQEQEDNTATVNQTDGRLNEAIINQTDDGNTATVTQSGTEDAPPGGTPINMVVIDQNGKMSTATVDQASDGSRVDINQNSSDEATVNQLVDGANNSVDIDQAGTLAGGGNSATINQGGDDNTFGVEQSSATGLDGNMVMGDQMGAGNTADVDQDGPGNRATVDQDGEENTIEIDQNSEAASGMPNVANATQGENTSDGTITIDQTQGLGIGQEGGNTATVNQTRGDENEATILQLKDNTATITQSGDKNSVSGTPSTATIDQSLSTSGTATVTQAQGTFGSTALISQEQEDNMATINQTNGRENTANISQTDDGNEATINQSGTVDTGSGIPSLVDIDQNGKDGMAMVTQTANGSEVTVDQNNGDDNSSTVTQSGRANLVQTEQFGDGSVTTVRQSGQENVGITIQSNLLNGMDPANGPADHTATLTQSGTINEALIGQGGLGNTAALTQAGEENFASTIQYGSDNSATTNQTSPMRNNTVNITQGRILNGAGAATAINTARGNRSAGDLSLALGTLTDTDVVQSEDNVATVNQTAGENQSVSLRQSGDMETATITQTGSDNTNNTTQAGERDVLTSTQAGSQGLVTVSQYGEETQLGNEATINQSGGNNTIDIGQIKVGNAVTYTQSGNNNNATGGAVGGIVRQIGEDNTAEITQTGMRGTVAVIQGNPAGTTFGGQTLASTNYDPVTNDAFDNTATVSQVGLDNLAASTQLGDKGSNTITQAGANNAAGIVQENVGAVRSMNNTATATQETGTDNNLIDIVQSGQQNMGTARQTGNVARSTINLTQRKDNNMATLTQSQGDNNVINVRQIPDNFDTQANVVTISQAGSDNEARLEQTGYNNRFTLTQTGNEHTVQQNVGNPFALQSGNNNVAMLTQAGNTDGVAGGHTINFDQSGTQNMAMINQSGEGSNTITLIQRDDKNTATLTQNEGSGNVIRVNQNPDNAGTMGGMVIITQTGGSDNEARLDQTGKENELTLTQDGDRNILRLNGGTPIAVQSGDNNTATLSQTGEDHIINFNQGGLNNTATVTQMNL